MTPTARAAAEDRDADFQRATAGARADLDAAVAELSRVRSLVTDEKLPLTQALRDAEERLLLDRSRLDDTARVLDERKLQLSTLQATMQAHRQERAYLSNLLDEYARNLETRIHVTELQRHREVLEEARLAPDTAELAADQVLEVQGRLLELSAERLLDVAGGTRFEGTAVGADGRVREVTFALVGPVALYLTRDGQEVGLAEQRLGSLEPNMIPLPDPTLEAAVRSLVADGEGALPFDPTLGNASRIEESKDTLLSQVAKGGPVMAPILLLAAVALTMAVAKWVQLVRIRQPTQRQVARVMAAVEKEDADQAKQEAGRVGGPLGAMLLKGIEHLDEPRELVEEVMYEEALDTRLRLGSYLPAIAVSAAAAPLLGLLGTVTGIINTFKLITVFGTGDAKTLSSGISEALITTEFGLIVAIPALLLHAWLARRSQRIVDRMERVAIALLNRLPQVQRRKKHAEAVTVSNGTSEQAAVETAS